MTVLLLLSDAVADVGELVTQWPGAHGEVRVSSLKKTDMAELTALHPDLVLIDATDDLGAAEEAARRLSLAWEIGLPPLLAVVDEGGVGRFRIEAVDDFVLAGAPAAEVAARIDKALRRAGPGAEEIVLRVGELTVNPDNYQVYIRGRPLDLTFKEFELLKFLAQRPGRVCDRDLLLREVWGYDYFGGTRTVDVHVRRLRAKLGPEHEALIETIRNVGYRLVPRPRER
jgi:DNA-binding response OmpR family regulator